MRSAVLALMILLSTALAGCQKQSCPPCSPGSPSNHTRNHRPDAVEELKKTPPPESSFKNGDVIFQSASFPDALAIRQVTKSPFSHCGVLFKEGNEWFVYEAAQAVSKTPFKDFIKNGDEGKYVVCRLRQSDTVLTDAALKTMLDFLKRNVDKAYDHKFAWNDDEMYCSELVWKAYYHAIKLKVGKLSLLGDYDLSDPFVREQVEKKWGKAALRLTEPVIAPGAIFDSPLLRCVR
jgi:hypothetical protein